MPKDIFIDNNVAKNFCNPVDQHYKVLVKWLFQTGCLVVSNRLISEYGRACGGSGSETSIFAIIDAQSRDGRLVRFRNAQLRALVFTRAQLRRLRSNRADHTYLKLVILSDRKLALTYDANLA